MVTVYKKKDTPLAMHIQWNVFYGYSILQPFLVLIVYTFILVFVACSC